MTAFTVGADLDPVDPKGDEAGSIPGPTGVPADETNI
jgi:hypothetical protein